MMESNAFASLTTVQLPFHSRIVNDSCCPDKDLVILFSRSGGLDRITLWNSNQGSKVWDADFGDESVSTHVVGIAWSPDGQTIAVIHEPPQVSLHSVQDGHIIISTPVHVPPKFQQRSCHLEAVWWFCSSSDPTDTSVIPDIFKRNDIITGTAQSILKTLPLLDNFQEESENLTATELFAFQGSHTHSQVKSRLPKAISTWPTLYADPKLTSVDSSIQSKPSIKPDDNLEEKDDSNINSILMLTDNLGNIYSFLDGTFPLGVISLGLDASFTSVVKSNRRPQFFGHLKSWPAKPKTYINPTIIDLPLLADRKTRDLARLSSIGRDLTWYAMRVVKEMRAIWFGNETSSGARELGPRWIRALETKQKDQFGQEDPNPILDLTWLLTTGRSSESLADFFGSGDQMSERGIQKWESTTSEALIRLRDYSEKRIAPACQRIHIILEELQGWEKLPHYSLFDLDCENLQQAVDLASRGVIIASWLAAVSRRELSRFREFIAWLRFENSNANSPGDSNVSRHDILEVNNYFMSGLVVSSIDKWFLGPVPQFRPRDLHIPEPGNGPLTAIFQHARSVANDSYQMAWQENITHRDLSHLDRNLDALIHELAGRCNRVFVRAAGAASRSATVHHHHESPIPRTDAVLRPVFSFRERFVQSEDSLFEYLLTPVADQNLLLLAQLRYSIMPSRLPFEIGIGLLECHLPQEGEEQSSISLLAADFFDDESVVIVYRLLNRDKQAFIANLSFAKLDYVNVQYNGDAIVPSREDMMDDVLERWRAGNIASIQMFIHRRRALTGCKVGGVTLAVNGRTNRRVACVLDETGTRLESLDLAEEGDDMEMADDVTVKGI